MKSLIALVILFGVATAVPSCRREIIDYTSKNLRCAERSIEIQGYVGKIAQGTMTYDQLAEIIASKCETANSASCYNDISTEIDGACNEAESLQHFRNAFKTVLTFNEYVCQNNGQKYLDFVKDDGAECYYNEEKSNCYTNGKNMANIGALAFKDENVCTIMDADWTCLHHLSDCDNQNVAIFYEQILMSLREKFSC